ncbi:MAG TPA: type II secretion system protein [Vicinamibacterales bacterium]|nr:type II secretion system protein [Vicinamibacterales bacterium]
MRRGEGRAGRSGGFTYLGLLALIVLIGILLARAAEVWSAAAQRDREQELLWVGHEYRAAIGRYVAHNHRYPATLTELLGATRADSDASQSSSGAGPATAPGVLEALGFRALRRLYRDPMTNSTDWDTVPSPDGHVMGVVSKSKLRPIKRTGFYDDDVAFADAETYAGWRFVYQPPTYLRSRTLAPGTAN